LLGIDRGQVADGLPGSIPFVEDGVDRGTNGFHAETLKGREFFHADPPRAPRVGMTFV
jgi:hypothetical protein